MAENTDMPNEITPPARPVSCLIDYIDDTGAMIY